MSRIIGSSSSSASSPPGGSSTTTSKMSRAGLKKVGRLAGNRTSESAVISIPALSQASMIHVSDPWCTEYVFSEEDIVFPKKILFRDYLCTQPLREIDLKGWNVGHSVFEIIRDSCRGIRSLYLDHVKGLSFDCFDTIRGLKELRNLSLNDIIDCPITKKIAQSIGSFKALRSLSIDGCHVTAPAEVFTTLSQTCAYVTSLSCARCKGIDVFALHAIGQWIQRFRRLHTLDFSSCTDLTNDGLLDVMVAGYNILSEVKLTHCRHLDTTALAGLRARMPNLQRLDLSHMALGNTVYEWLTEGGIFLTHLNLSNSPELDDAALARIGRVCFHLKFLNISRCEEVTDYGVENFFRDFYGDLEHLDMTACPMLGAGAAVAVSKRAKSIQTLRLNGLSKMTSPSLATLWKTTKGLMHFEMCSNLTTTTTHRRSSMPHFSDTVLMTAPSRRPGGGNRSRELGTVGEEQDIEEGVDVNISAASGSPGIIDNALINPETPPRPPTKASGNATSPSSSPAGSVSSSSTALSSAAAAAALLEAVAGKMACCLSLATIKLVGAFQVTDVGLCKLARDCGKLQHVDVSYCHGASDVFLQELAVYSKHLHTFIGTGCMQITSNGLQALASGCAATGLKRIEVNGCSKVMDAGAYAIASLVNLETLGLRGCDYIADAPMHAIAENCTNLKSLDLMNLDLVSIDVIRSFIQHCPYIVSLNCSGCNFTAKEYASVVDRQLPFCHPEIGKCKLTDLPRAVACYNAYVRKTLKDASYVETLQKFGHYILTTYLFRLSKKLKIKKLKDLARIFRAFREAIRKSANRSLKEKRNEWAEDLQYLVRRLYAVHLARKKARLLRKQRDARQLLQRVFRGFAVRKRFVAMFTRLYIFYNRIGHLVHKYLVVRAARDNHRRILCVNGFARMVPVRMDFRRGRWAVRCLQLRLRYYLLKNKARMHAEAMERERQRIEGIRREAAARKLQRNLKACLFNKTMSGFILTSCIFFRVDYDEKLWNSTVMQRYWRGYMQRLKNWRAEQRSSNEYRAATKLQALHRCRVKLVAFGPWRDAQRRALKRWKILAVLGKPRLTLGRHAHTIQRYGHRFVFMCRRHNAATHIERLARGHTHRNMFKILVLQMHEDKANKIKKAFHIYKCRQERKFQLARNHMAAYKIWQQVDKIFEPRRAQIRLAIERQQAWDDLQAKKKDLLLTKRTRIVTRIRERYQTVMVHRIQNGWRNYRARVAARVPTPSKSRRQSSVKDMLSEQASAKQSIVGAPVRGLKKLVSSVPTPFGSTDLIEAKDTNKFINSVLKYQVKNILQEGLVNFHITLGELEAKIFLNQQNALEKGRLPFFKKIPQDMSADLKLQIFLWVQYGSGKGCICHVEVAQKPPISKAAMKVRVREEEAQGYKIAWNANLHYELRGICSVMQGKGDFAIQDLVVTTSPEEENEVRNKGPNYTVSADLSTVGMHSKIWTTARTPLDEDNLYKFVNLASHRWFDDRLARIAKGFNMTEADIFKMRDIFTEICKGKLGRAKIADVYTYMGDYPYNPIAEWVFLAVKPENTTSISFSEYVNMICSFAMLGQKEMMKFVFQSCDPDGKQYLTKEQFDDMMAVLGADSPFNVKGWMMQYKRYYDRKLNNFFIGNFEAFLHQNPGVLWAAYDLQQRLIHYNLGKDYWAKKMEQFRVMRADLGIKLIS